MFTIFYDGGSNFLNTKDLDYQPFLYGENDDYDEIILDSKYLEEIPIIKQKINQMNLEKLVNLLALRGLNSENLNYIQNSIKDELYKRLDLIELEISNNHIKKENSVRDYFQKSENNFELYYLVFRNEGNFIICDTDLINCFNKALTKVEQIQLLNGRLSINNKKAYYVSESLNSLNYHSSLNKIFNFKEQINGINIFSNQKIDYEISNNSQFVKIKPQNQSRYLISNSELNGMNIVLNYDASSKSESEKNISKARYDQTFYTGCLNIYDSYIKNVSIKIINSPCEDSINFVRSKGSINTFESDGSKFDSIDADFSEIQFKNTLISNSGNDCVDVSKGKYSFEIMDLKNCLTRCISR